MYNDFGPKEQVTRLQQSFKFSLNAIRSKTPPLLTKGLSKV